MNALTALVFQHCFSFNWVQGFYDSIFLIIYQMSNLQKLPPFTGEIVQNFILLSCFWNPVFVTDTFHILSVAPISFLSQIGTFWFTCSRATGLRFVILPCWSLQWFVFFWGNPLQESAAVVLSHMDSIASHVVKCEDLKLICLISIPLMQTFLYRQLPSTKTIVQWEFFTKLDRMRCTQAC